MTTKNLATMKVPSQELDLESFIIGFYSFVAGPTPAMPLKFFAFHLFYQLPHVI